MAARSRFAVVALVAIAAFAAVELRSQAFVSSAAPPAAAELSALSLRGASKPAATAFAGASSSYSLFSVTAAAVGIAAACRLAVVAMQAKRQRTWAKLQKRNELYLKRHPPPLLTKRELRKRVTKAQLMLRDDVWATEFPVYIDPRDEKYQWSVQETKAVMESPDYEDVAQVRAKIGISMPPFTMTDAAQIKLRASNQERTNTDESDMTATAKKKRDRGIDLGDIDSKFMQFKGIKMTKKQQAQFASKK